VKTFEECLKKEIRFEKKVDFKYSPKYSVYVNEDGTMCKETAEVVSNIYDKAAELPNGGLAPHEIIVDVTGGRSSMTVGAVLASLAKNQDVEVVGGKYDEKGNPMGGNDSYPVQIGFEPQLRKIE